jgi:hypothetical protein
MGFPKGASIPFANLQLPAGSKPRSRFKLIFNFNRDTLLVSMFSCRRPFETDAMR